jgi:hypothetical protein
MEQSGKGDEVMTPAGWFTMLSSVGFVVTLFGWCIWRVLTDKKAEGHIHGIEDIEKGED